MIHGDYAAFVASGTMGCAVSVTRKLNPAWLRSITPADGAPVKARIPLGAAEKLSAAALDIVPMSEARNVGGTHRVRRGETLSRIARRYSVSTLALARANRISTKTRLRAGRVLRLPDGAEEPLVTGNTGSSSSSRAAKSSRKAAAGSAEYQYHVVRQGDSLWSISQKYLVINRGTTLPRYPVVSGGGADRWRTRTTAATARKAMPKTQAKTLNFIAATTRSGSLPTGQEARG